jgi:hypothetical protein
VVFVIYVIIGVFVASGHHYFEHLDALKHRLGSSRSAVVAPHPLRDQPAYQVGAASASGDSDKRMVCAMPKTGGTVDRVDLTDRHPDAVTAIYGTSRGEHLHLTQEGRDKGALDQVQPAEGGSGIWTTRFFGWSSVWWGFFSSFSCFA